MDNIEYKVRLARLGDSSRVWEIRNNPAVRANSENQEEILFEKHEPWFKSKYFGDERNYCYVIETDQGYVIGYCRLDFDIEKKDYIISIALDSAYHGRGLGQILLREALVQFPEQVEIIATIKKNNIPSIKLFQKNNFIIRSEDEVNYYLNHEAQL